MGYMFNIKVKQRRRTWENRKEKMIPKPDLIYGMKSRGITFIELIVAVAILLIALSGVLATFVVGKMGVVSVKNRVAVRNTMRAKGEELKNTPYASIISSGPGSVVVDVGPDLTQGTPDDLTGTQTITVVEVVEGGYRCKSVKITLSWQEMGRGGVRTVNDSLVTYITQHL